MTLQFTKKSPLFANEAHTTKIAKVNDEEMNTKLCIFHLFFSHQHFIKNLKFALESEKKNCCGKWRLIFITINFCQQHLATTTTKKVSFYRFLHQNSTFSTSIEKL
jgi:hypothetical protein